MKKDFMKAMFLMLCAVFAFTFTACSDDDDPVDDAATQVAGAYTGELNVYMTATGDEPIATDTKTITLSKKSENTVDLVINNFTLTVFTLPVELGNVTIPNCTLSGADGNYSFSGEVSLSNITVPIVGQADCKVQFTNAQVSGNTLALPLVIEVYQPGTTEDLGLGITANFTGTK